MPPDPTPNPNPPGALPPDSLAALNARLLAFARERDWEQFHSPKNLAMALAGECGELLEHFQWLTQAQSAELAPDKRQAVAHEVADILIYLIRLCERLDIDPIAAAYEKIAINEARYPAERVRGDARRAGSTRTEQDSGGPWIWTPTPALLLFTVLIGTLPRLGMCPRPRTTTLGGTYDSSSLAARCTVCFGHRYGIGSAPGRPRLRRL